MNGSRAREDPAEGINAVIVKYSKVFLLEVRKCEAGDGWVQPDHISQSVCPRLKIDRAGLRFLLNLLCKSGYCNYTPRSGIVLTPKAAEFLNGFVSSDIKSEVRA